MCVEEVLCDADSEKEPLDVFKSRSRDSNRRAGRDCNHTQWFIVWRFQSWRCVINAGRSSSNAFIIVPRRVLKAWHKFHRIALAVIWNRKFHRRPYHNALFPTGRHDNRANAFHMRSRYYSFIWPPPAYPKKRQKFKPAPVIAPLPIFGLAYDVSRRIKWFFKNWWLLSIGSLLNSCADVSQTAQFDNIVAVWVLLIARAMRVHTHTDTQ